MHERVHAQDARDRLDMAAAVRPSTNGWSVFVPPGTAYELNNPEEPESDVDRLQRQVNEEHQRDLDEDRDDYDRSSEEGWIYKD